jgi:succinyl-diaminopimelate desuccinylase
MGKVVADMGGGNATLKETLAQYERDIVRDIQRLMRIRSVRGEPEPGAPFGAGCRDALREALSLGEAMGMAVKNVDGYAGHIEIGSGEEIVCVLHHLDVVDEGDGWDEDIPPYAAVHKDGCIFGRGAFDNKGPAVVSLYCLKAIRDMGLPLGRRVRLILGTDEESEWEDMAYYFEREPLPVMGFSPDLGYPICNYEKGMLRLRFEAPGIAPPGRAPELARAGIAPGIAPPGIAPDLARAGRSTDPAGAGRPSDPARAGRSPILSVEGGSAQNKVPDACAALLDLSPGAGFLPAGFDASAFAGRAEAMGGRIERRGGGTVHVFRGGRSAFGSAPEQGDNAIAHMLEILEPLYMADGGPLGRFLRFARQRIGYETDGASLGIKVSDEVSGPLTANMSFLRADAAAACLHVDARFPVTRGREAIEAAARGVSSEYGLVFSPRSYKAPLYVKPDSPLILALSRAYESVTGEKAGLYGMGGATYARVLRNNGVAFGPGGLPGGSALPASLQRKGGTHQANECCVVADMMRHAEICTAAIVELANL